MLKHYRTNKPTISLTVRRKYIIYKHVPMMFQVHSIWWTLHRLARGNQVPNGDNPWLRCVACWTMAAVAASRRQVKLLHHLAPASHAGFDQSVRCGKKTQPEPLILKIEGGWWPMFSLKPIQWPNKLQCAMGKTPLYGYVIFIQPRTGAYNQPSWAYNGIRDITHLITMGIWYWF